MDDRGDVADRGDIHDGGNWMTLGSGVRGVT